MRFINNNETIEDLQFNNLKIIQKKDGFRFGVDSVLLANFVSIKKNETVLDLGTGSGIIPILLAGKTNAKKIIGLEIQEHMVEMALRSIELNNLNNRISIIQGDIKNAVEFFGTSSFNTVITNPPYIKKGDGLINPTDTKAIARHELFCNLEDIIRVSSKILVPGGQFAIVHKPQRLVDIIYLMRKYSIEPKVLQMVCPNYDKSPSLLLINGTRGGNAEIKIKNPLYIYKPNGEYTEEINKIYCRGDKN